MKKLLEVLQYGENEIRFNTDLDVQKNPEVLMEILPMIMMSMATKLWGGNETSVLSIIRTLSIADLALSVNREEMIRQLDKESEAMAQVMKEAKMLFEKSGGKVLTFAPDVKPPKGYN